jgi:hypothetical protein
MVDLTLCIKMRNHSIAAGSLAACAKRRYDLHKFAANAGATDKVGISGKS